MDIYDSRVTFKMEKTKKCPKLLSYNTYTQWMISNIKGSRMEPSAMPVQNLSDLDLRYQIFIRGWKQNP